MSSPVAATASGTAAAKPAAQGPPGANVAVPTRGGRRGRRGGRGPAMGTPSTTDNVIIISDDASEAAPPAAPVVSAVPAAPAAAAAPSTPEPAAAGQDVGFGARGGRGGARGSRGGAARGGRVGARGGAGSGAAGSCYVCGAEGHVGLNCPQNLPVDASSQETTVTPLGPKPEHGKIVELYGDLMTTDDSLCHCVSACMAMGKGIAVLFNQRFGRIDKLKAQHVGVGGVAVLDDGPRFVYYLVTKPRYNDKPTYDTLRASLVAMRQHMASHGQTAISMPELGCGLDGLKWPNVQRLLADVFAESGVTITVYHFKPARQMWTRKGTFANK